MRKQNTATPRQEIIQRPWKFIHHSFIHSTSAYLGLNQELGSALGAKDVVMKRTETDTYDRYMNK